MFQIIHFSTQVSLTSFLSNNWASTVPSSSSSLSAETASASKSSISACGTTARSSSSVPIQTILQGRQGTFLLTDKRRFVATWYEKVPGLNMTLPATYRFATHVDKWRYKRRCFIQTLQDHFINFHNATFDLKALRNHFVSHWDSLLNNQLKMASYSAKNLMCKLINTKDERKKCQGRSARHRLNSQRRATENHESYCWQISDRNGSSI